MQQLGVQASGTVCALTTQTNACIWGWGTGGASPEQKCYLETRIWLRCTPHAHGGPSGPGTSMCAMGTDSTSPGGLQGTRAVGGWVRAG